MLSNNIERRSKRNRVKWCTWPAKKKSLWEDVVEECRELEALYKQNWLQRHVPCIESMTEHFKHVLYYSLIPAFQTVCALVIQKKVISDRKQLFDPIDCLAEILYNTNRKYSYRVDEWKSSYAIMNEIFSCNKIVRPIYPLHWILTRDEAATKIQALVRGFLSRRKISLEDLRVSCYAFYLMLPFLAGLSSIFMYHFKRIYT